jgi:hypothetical protein
MTIQVLKDAVARNQPLVLKLSNGERLTVPDADFIFFGPPVAEPMFIVVDTNGRFHHVNAKQVVAIELNKVPQE